MARVLYLRKTIETWGRGMNLIFSSCRDEGREPPSVVEGNGSVKLVFRRVKSANKMDEKSPQKEADKSPNKPSRKTVKSRVLTIDAPDKSANKSPIKSANKSPTKTANKISRRSPCLRALSGILPASMRADARNNLIAVFSEIVMDRFVTSTQIRMKTELSNGTVKDALAMLKEMGAIFRVGAKKNGHWLISRRLIGEEGANAEF